MPARVRYRNPETGRWAKKDDPGAVIYGVQQGRKITKVSPEDVSVTTQKLGKAAPTLKFRNKGQFIPAEVYEAIAETEEFKKIRQEKAEKLESKANRGNVSADEVPFYQVQSTFATLAKDFGFKSLEIATPEGTVKTKRLDQAIKEVAREGYRAAKEVEEAKKQAKKDEEKGMKPKEFDSLIILEISDDGQGNYFIIRLN